jgi:hypothetical protein
VSYRSLSLACGLNALEKEEQNESNIAQERKGSK